MSVDEHNLETPELGLLAVWVYSEGACQAQAPAVECEAGQETGPYLNYHLLMSQGILDFVKVNFSTDKLYVECQRLVTLHEKLVIIRNNYNALSACPSRVYSGSFCLPM